MPRAPERAAPAMTWQHATCCARHLHCGQLEERSDPYRHFRARAMLRRLEHSMPSMRSRQARHAVLGMTWCGLYCHKILGV